MQAENANRLKKIFNKAITGQVSLNVRKQLASGKTISVTVDEDKYQVVVTGGHAFMTLGDSPVIDAPFVPWSDVDDDYEKMIASFDDEGVDEDWFQSASELYLARFD
jgi:hypothetical protein